MLWQLVSSWQKPSGQMSCSWLINSCVLFISEFLLYYQRNLSLYNIMLWEVYATWQRIETAARQSIILHYADCYTTVPRPAPLVYSLTWGAILNPQPVPYCTCGGGAYLYPIRTVEPLYKDRLNKGHLSDEVAACCPNYTELCTNLPLN